ncbi:flagellar protein FliS [Candidatus Koribacter versatilis Ellin345]|uniref:Flagellar protein FliS n=1 Tax=Koribacter versatilis (strain Ellin345) TaxID=204669 RepID=Q1IMG2_KORVE|nr:flagellar export chaperone FliS [Candidatus Koribacter versatilis]ABF41938.1 flagellar protein FliS [Candidatus Koribacter versatilis Ellin345]
MTDNPDLAYRENEALATDPLGLVVVLYDMLLKDLHEAVVSVSAGDVEKRSNAVRHCLLVLQELQGTLDFERGGVVAENLDRFYNFIRAKLLEGQIKASSEIFEQQITLVASIREAWQQVRRDQLATEVGSSDTAPIIPGPLVDVETTVAAHWSA